MLPFPPCVIYPVLQLLNYLVLRAIMSIMQRLLLFVWDSFLPGVDQTAGSGTAVPNPSPGAWIIDWNLLLQILGYNLLFGFFGYAFLSPRSTTILIIARLTLCFLSNLHAVTQHQTLPVPEFHELPDLLAAVTDLAPFKPSFDSGVDWEDV